MKRRIAMAGLWLAVSAAAADDVRAGEVRGVLRMSPVTPAASVANPYPGNLRSLARPQHPPRGRVTDAVIYIESVPAGTSVAARSNAAPTLGQRDQAFEPRVLPVAAGTTVEFPNFDPIYHNVFSLSPARRFDLGKYPRGQSRRVTFDRVGIVNVYCEIHADMEAFVLVLPNRAFTQPDAKGVFRLPELPAGKYVLRMWHPDRPALRREIVVPATGMLSVEFDG